MVIGLENGNKKKKRGDAKLKIRFYGSAVNFPDVLNASL